MDKPSNRAKKGINENLQVLTKSSKYITFDLSRFAFPTFFRAVSWPTGMV